MKKNPIGKRLKEYTASAINTGGEVYEKIMASGKEHAEEQGAIENALCQYLILSIIIGNLKSLTIRERIY
ncbi:hypothetical protein [Treponema phagedenis]|uniref:hypothetical protein n=1 Tax=Treponema phagedenis TaxID=162 RepID=UPI001581A8C9|nr:hypothetical protein [Treponema phagedenis]QKS91976.1 hypothetical protein HPJ96_04985 [Treponema phagedenis]